MNNINVINLKNLVVYKKLAIVYYTLSCSVDKRTKMLLFCVNNNNIKNVKI